MSLVSQTARVCPKCGGTIPSGQAQCACSARPRYWLHSPETVLLLCFVGLGAAFVVTGVAARSYRAERRALAEQWHNRGVADLARGRAEGALADFRTAVTYARDNVPDEQQQEYQLDLAEALIIAGQVDEARSYLLDLWQHTPGNSKINIDLARLAARDGDDGTTRRYYEAAINGVWEGNTGQVAKDRFATRIELYRYLRSRGDASAAQSVLLAAAASFPPDSSLNVQVAKLMLESGHAQEALTQFEAALRIDRRNDAALIGAGLASFELGHDSAAVRYLEQVSRGNPGKSLGSTDSQQVGRTLMLARMTLMIDPLSAGLGPQDRAQRTVRSYDAAVVRLEGCAAARNITLPKVSLKTRAVTAQESDLANLYMRLMEMTPTVRESDLIRNPQRVEQAMNLVFEAEATATAECGSPQDPADAALARIAGRVEDGHP